MAVEWIPQDWSAFYNTLLRNTNLSGEVAKTLARGEFQAFHEAAVKEYIRGGWAARAYAADEALIVQGQPASYAFDLWKSQSALSPIGSASGSAASGLSSYSPVAIAKPPVNPPSTPYSAFGFLSADLGPVAAAAAPILGVALGVGLYESNPGLWTRISQALIPWAYPEENKIAVLADSDGNTYLPKSLLERLKDIFDEDVKPVEEYTYEETLPDVTISGTFYPAPYEYRGAVYGLGATFVAVIHGYQIVSFSSNYFSGSTYDPEYNFYWAPGGYPAYYDGAELTITPLSGMRKALAEILGTVEPGRTEYPEGTSKWGGNSVDLDSVPTMPVLRDFGTNGSPDTTEDWVPVPMPYGGSDGSVDPTVNPDPTKNTNPEEQIQPYIPKDGIPFEFPDGTVMFPDGTIVYPKQKVAQLPDGRIITDIIVSPDGQSGTWSDGSPLPSGTKITDLTISTVQPGQKAAQLPDGRIVIDIIVSPDGQSGTYSDGTPLPDDTKIIDLVISGDVVRTQDGTIIDAVPVPRGRIIPSPVPRYNPAPDPHYDPTREPTRPDKRPEPSKDEPDKPADPPPSKGGTDLGPDPIIPLPWGSAGGLIAVYHPSQSILEQFARWLWVTWQDATIDKIWNNPFDGVISLHEIYCTPPDIGTRNIKSGFLDSGISSPIVDRYTSIDCGSIVIPEYWGNYLDYSPYSKAFVYLPFIGIVELDADDIVGHAVHIEYRIDVYNGSCIAVITVAKTGYNTIMYQFSGNCAVELPLSGGSQAAIKAGMLEAAAWGLGSVVGGIMTGGSALSIGADLAQGAASAVHSVVSAKSSVQHSGSFGSSYGAMGNKKPFIIVRRPIQVQVPNYNLQYGYPAHKLVLLNSCHGYLRCREIHVISSTASDDEKALIEEMLKNGVYIDE